MRPSTSWALASISLSMLLATLGISIANVALPTLATAFGASFPAVQWVVLAYLLATTTLIVSVGRLGDLTGRRRLLLTGILLFTSEAGRVLHTPSFWVKIVTLPGAILYTFTVRRRVAAQSGPNPSRLTRVTASVSLLLWFTVAAAGRWIGFSS